MTKRKGLISLAFKRANDGDDGNDVYMSFHLFLPPTSTHE